MLGGADGQVVQYNQIDHNYFHDIQYGGGNGWETIRMGLSSLAPSKGFNTIELNLFRATAGDPETISIKASDNVLRYNTMRFNPGELVLRHGNRNQVYGNYILGEGNAKAGGIRICGADHRIYNNYVADVKSGAAIFLEGGDGDGTDVPGKQHYRVYRTQVVNNTVVGGRIQIGGAHPLEPIDCTVANNLVQGDGIVEAAGKGTRYAGNIVSAGPPRDAREVRVADNLALVQVGELWKLGTGSPAIDASATGFDYVTDDIDGQPRARTDVGADELSNAPAAHRPLVQTDVGPDAP
jgi:poly(beta-D-mannuronate) lyase